jgi:hypothetical protein
VASSQILRRVKTEDGSVDVMGCVRSFYPKIVIFYILGHRDNLVFYFFACAYK